MVRPDLILIGYWEEKRDGRWPNPAAFVDHSWDESERDQVADYLTRGFVARAWMGYSPCRFCGKNNGSLELTDGVYARPEGLAHYAEDHGLKPPSEFVEHALVMIDRFESARIDQSWWLGQVQSGRGGPLGGPPAGAQ